MKSFVSKLKETSYVGRVLVSRDQPIGCNFMRSFSTATHEDVNISSYDSEREKEFAKQAHKKFPIPAPLQPALKHVYMAQALFEGNTRSNDDIIKENLRKEKTAIHPDAANGGKTFIRTTKEDGKKALIEAPLGQIKVAPFIVVGGKDSSQTQKDCSAIAAGTERLCGIETPEALHKILPGENPPLVYLSSSTTPKLDRYASEGHISYAAGEPYTHREAQSFAHKLLFPRYIDNNGKIITNPQQITPLCGYSYSAGGKQWLAYIQALEDKLVDQGIPKEEVRNIIGGTIRLAGIALMPDRKGLALSPVDTLYTVSIYDGGTRPQLEEYQRVLGNPVIHETIERNGMALVDLSMQNSPVRHRLAVLGTLPVMPTTIFGHAPNGYITEINKRPLLAELYKAYLTSAPKERVVGLQAEFDERAIKFDQLVCPNKEEGNFIGSWRYNVTENFATQIAREHEAKAQSLSKNTSRGK